MHDRRLLSFLRRLRRFLKRLRRKFPGRGIFQRSLLSSENRFLSDETYFLLCKNCALRILVKPRKTVVLGVRGVRGVTYFY
jgi:DNA-directed RNA polymerase subunit RPC12/RpoP